MTLKQTNNPAKFTNFPTDTNWVEGICSGFSFQAKLFDDGSEFGINEGRVSKLEIKNSNGITVANYDRGWDMELQTGDTDPAGDTKTAFDAIMQLLENSPRRFDEK